MMNELLSIALLLSAIGCLVVTVGVALGSTQEEAGDEVESGETEDKKTDLPYDEETREKGVCMIDPYCEGQIEVPATELQPEQQQQQKEEDENEETPLEKLGKKLFPYCDTVSSNFRGVCFDRENGNPELNSLQCMDGAQILDPLQCLDMQLNTTENDFSDPEKAPFLCENEKSLPELCRDATDR